MKFSILIISSSSEPPKIVYTVSAYTAQSIQKPHSTYPVPCSFEKHLVLCKCRKEEKILYLIAGNSWISILPQTGERCINGFPYVNGNEWRIACASDRSTEVVGSPTSTFTRPPSLGQKNVTTSAHKRVCQIQNPCTKSNMKKNHLNTSLLWSMSKKLYINCKICHR